MKFDFEKYWSEHGLHTEPAIMGLAFKECASKAVVAALKYSELAATDSQQLYGGIHSHIQNALLALKLYDLGSAQSAIECAAKLVEEKFTSTNSAMDKIAALVPTLECAFNEGDETKFELLLNELRQLCQ